LVLERSGSRLLNRKRPLKQHSLPEWGMRQARLTSDRMTRTITAPMVALTISRTALPPRLTPSCGSSQLATSAPMYADHDVADQSKPGAAHDQPGEPARDRAITSAAMIPMKNPR